MMNFKEVKELFNTAQQKVMLEKGMLRGVTIPDAKAMGYTDDQVTALVAAKRVIAPRKKGVTGFKVSEKGCLQVMGIRNTYGGIFLYKDEWEALLDSADLIRKALSDYAPRLASKASEG